MYHLLRPDFRTYGLIRSPVAMVGHDPLSGFHWAGFNNGTKVCLVFDPRLLWPGMWSMTGINTITSPPQRMFVSLLMGGTIVTSLLFL